MPFLEAHLPEHRELLSREALTLTLKHGEYLMQRGDGGSDIYLLQSGVLEVVDRTRVPEIPVNSLTPGAVVGELAFVTDTSRLVDVRAGTDCVLLAWERDTLKRLFQEHPVIAATFHAEVARLTANRLRRLTDRAIAGSFDLSESVDEDDDVRTWVQRIVGLIKEAIPQHDAQLRVAPESPAAQSAVSTTLDRLETAIAELFEAHSEPDAAAFAERELRRELMPYLVRSSLADRALRRPGGRLGTVQILAQSMINMAMGDGVLGVAMDRWILDRPTFAALRELQPELVRTIQRGLPDGRASEVQILNVGSGSLVAGLLTAIEDHPHPVTVSVIDQSARALALLPDPEPGANATLVPKVANLVALASGDLDLSMPPQDIVVMHHLIEVLPERLAFNLLLQCRRQLAPDGALIVATLGPSADRALLDRLLGWPTIRRPRNGVGELLRAAGFGTVSPVTTAVPGQLIVALEGT
ncbi:MAG: cyclic nucleotide-binding domain-containing protein [Myxococcota bacterium]